MVTKQKNGYTAGRIAFRKGLEKKRNCSGYTCSYTMGSLKKAKVSSVPMVGVAAQSEARAKVSHQKLLDAKKKDYRGR